uniref:J domain-containing protein n=1 Tax=Kalanchoe fedtschenkoi TaxID=63787 RepID=A0A7N0ZZS0_KALFE
MDYYEILGVKRSATKPQIKEAFRNLAMKFHPDKHPGSSEAVKEGATLRFKQVSEAYQVLMNDGKRADYDSLCGSGRSTRGGFASTSSSYEGSYGCGTGDYNAYKERHRHRRYAQGGRGDSGFDAAGRFLSNRALLFSFAFASVMVGAVFIFDKGRDRICKMHNSRKSNEEAMESIRKTNRWAQRGRGSKPARYYYNYPPHGD